MVPASTMKILTSLAAIDRWGMDHRFHTDFYRSADGWLWVKGHGDPYLVSEELDRVAKALKSRGVGPCRPLRQRQPLRRAGNRTSGQFQHREPRADRQGGA
jgi:D-alanyl-D-alanine carboxypeptidase